MKSTIQKTIKHAIVMDSNDYAGILDYLSSRGYICEVDARCVDGTTRTPVERPEELLEYPNHASRRITSLRFKTSGYSSPERIEITFSNNAHRPGELTVTSEKDEDAMAVASEIIRRCKEMRPLYSVFTAGTGPDLWLSVVGACVVIWLIYAYIPVEIIRELQNQGGTLLFVMVGVFCAVLTSWLTSHLRDKLLPVFVFYSGKEIARFSIQSHWRKAILWFFITAIFGGCIRLIFKS